ncbi:hypothetical protein MKX03_024488 [Papaver bracteatum]|nr:hypothetical protein MKX03_024488 [Papaver bracteatum]
MAIEEARTRMNDLRISEVPTKAVQSTTEKEKEESTEVVVPTKLEEAGRKYCCATSYRSYERVTHVKGRENQLYYSNRNPKAGRLNLPGLIRKFNTICNFCGEIMGWHFCSLSTGAFCNQLLIAYGSVLFDFTTWMAQCLVQYWHIKSRDRNIDLGHKLQFVSPNL